MTGRERVLAALRHEAPDRVPIDLGGTESSGITAGAYWQLALHLGLDIEPPPVFDPYQQVAKIDDVLREQFGVDTVPLLIEPASWQDGFSAEDTPCRLPAKWAEEQTPDGGRVVRGDEGQVVARLPKAGHYFDPVFAPLAECESIADVEARRAVIGSFDLPAYADEEIAATAERAGQLAQGDRAVVLNLMCHFLAAGAILRGFEQWMTDLVLEPALADAILDILLESYVARVDEYAEAVGPHVDVVLLNDDLGTQEGGIISVESYRRFVRPCQARLIERIEERIGAPVLFHSCGAVRSFIPDLIEVGVDALNPVQVSARGMDPASLKREFGRDLTFWGGGCDTQHVLPRGTPEEVRAEVRRRIVELSSDGGFVFTQVHNVQPDVPPENVVAMFEEAGR